jgi:hypothetical protein
VKVKSKSPPPLYMPRGGGGRGGGEGLLQETEEGDTPEESGRTKEKRRPQRLNRSSKEGPRRSMTSTLYEPCVGNG